MPPLECPICGATVDPKQSATLPFCSPRCRQIDLGRWLGEQYSVPSPRRDEGEDAESTDEPASE